MSSQIQNKVADILVKWGQERITNAKGILNKFEANTGTNNLQQSLIFSAPEINGGSVIIRLKLPDYYTFVDQGVQGIGMAQQEPKKGRTDKFDLNKKGYKTTRAYPKQALTTGKYKFKTPYVGRKMVESISEWITNKPVLIRANRSEDSKTSVIPRKETLAFIIAKSIKRTGIGKTMFFSDTFNDEAFTELKDMIEKELGGAYRVQFTI